MNRMYTALSNECFLCRRFRRFKRRHRMLNKQGKNMICHPPFNHTQTKDV